VLPSRSRPPALATPSGMIPPMPPGPVAALIPLMRNRRTSRHTWPALKPPPEAVLGSRW
jgi:hypothetical protein